MFTESIAQTTSSSRTIQRSRDVLFLCCAQLVRSRHCPLPPMTVIKRSPRLAPCLAPHGDAGESPGSTGLTRQDVAAPTGSVGAVRGPQAGSPSSLMSVTIGPLTD